MDPDLELLEAVAVGDEHALVALIQRHKEGVFRFLYRMLGNEHDAAELSEEVFVKVWNSADGFRSGRGQVASWILSIAANHCRDYMRRQRRRPWISLFEASSGRDEGLSVSESEADPSADTLRTVEMRELVDRMEAEVARLPERLRTPFVLAALEERPHREVAEILNVSEKTVETRLYRARKHLREALGEV